MKKIYTAIGNLRVKTTLFGKKYPVIVLNGEEIVPTEEEFKLWGQFKRNFVFADSISNRFIAEGIGETDEDALYDLLS